MITLRSIVYLIALLITVVLFSIPITVLGLVLSNRSVGALANAWGRTNLFLLRSICGLGYEISGLDRLPGQNCILVAKHQSAWETIALRGLLPPEQAWILKRELLAVPFFGWALRMSGAIAIDRSSGRKAVKQVIEKGTEALRNGRWVIVFPEGTRVAPGERKKYGIGGALLAEKSGYQIVPIAHNAGVFWKRRGVKKYPGTVQVVVGPPINTAGKKAAVINAELEEWIERQVGLLPRDRDG